MSPSHPTPGRQDPKTPRSARHQASAGSSDPAQAPPEADAQDAIDPELLEDLGAEYELRGDQLEAELEALRVESAEYRDHAMRAQAEFDNFRKRITREREEERRRASERLVTELLPALDNLERAIEHTTAGGDLKHLLAGVEAVHAQILGVLGKEGVSVIDPTGEHFDPMVQQAVSQREDTSVPDGTVIEVFQKGYSLGERVIRSAMVVVSTGGPQAQE
ncbi:MAG: nucleotide exchange factor GrpE [Coriobacteriia bacterium]|nr:nucleotide exchange factor GrpE [Coriobacteriia bacterium]